MSSVACPVEDSEFKDELELVEYMKEKNRSTLVDNVPHERIQTLSIMSGLDVPCSSKHVPWLEKVPVDMRDGTGTTEHEVRIFPWHRYSHPSRVNSGWLDCYGVDWTNQERMYLMFTKYMHGNNMGYNFRAERIFVGRLSECCNARDIGYDTATLLTPPMMFVLAVYYDAHDDTSACENSNSETSNVWFEKLNEVYARDDDSDDDSEAAPAPNPIPLFKKVDIVAAYRVGHISARVARHMLRFTIEYITHRAEGRRSDKFDGFNCVK
jgi:hypothetical protein